MLVELEATMEEVVIEEAVIHEWHAADAAGFRPCHNCRRDREAPSTYSSGAGIVCRAVSLVLDGALDRGSEQALGSSLGVSPRHLRRLFRLHLGATPDQLARSARAHFARRLLDDTELSITEIALAAGFGSVRQFNRVCLETFKFRPRELRQRRRLSDRPVADGGLLLRMAYRPPLDWATMLNYFAARAIPGVESVAEGIYRRTILVDGDPGAIEFWPGGDGHLLVRVHLPRWERLIHLVQQARRVFNLDLDLRTAAPHLGTDRLLSTLLEGRPGVRPPGTWDPFEVGVAAILGDRLLLPAPREVVGRLVERHGTPVAGFTAMGLSHVFPSPTTLAEADLADLGISSDSALAVRRFAMAVAGESLSLDRASSLDQLLAALTVIPGLDIGAAHYLALRMGEPNAFPWGDAGIRAYLVRRRYQELSPHQVAQIAEPWRPWRALAAVLLSLEYAATPSVRPALRGIRRAGSLSSTALQPGPTP
ncbi:MAG: AlkA N-terminal domain-containing protein [Candidatus Dormiibacterota bacterium]